MGFHEQVSNFSVSTLRNDVVAYRQVLRLTTVTGSNLFLAFSDAPPPDWLQFVGSDTNVFLPAADFDATYQVLHQESPVFVTALVVAGLRAFSLDSGDQVPGEALNDPEALAQFMAKARAAGMSEAPQVVQEIQDVPEE